MIDINGNAKRLTLATELVARCPALSFGVAFDAASNILDLLEREGLEDDGRPLFDVLVPLAEFGSFPPTITIPRAAVEAAVAAMSSVVARTTH